MTSLHPSSSSPSFPSSHPILCLQPVRSVLLPFLSDVDGARLLRVSRTTALVLLPGFTFHQHVFEGETQHQMLRMRALYEAYDMRPTRMCLWRSIKTLSLEEGSGRSPFPSTLTSLLLGPLPQSIEEGRSVENVAMFDPEGEAACDAISYSWTQLSGESSDEEYEEALQDDYSLPVRQFCICEGPFNWHISPSLLPAGLRRLQLANQFKAFIPPSSIPCLEVLQMDAFDLPLPLLPSTLIHLALPRFRQPLSPGVLPSSLLRLRLDAWNQPLEMNVLPASLQALAISSYDKPLPPGVLPAGLTHLALWEWSQPLEMGSLPPSLLSLDLGLRFDHPLSPGVLPPSLRVFWHGRNSSYPLHRGVLPEGLQVVHVNLTQADVDLEAGVLPLTLLVLRLILRPERRIAPGAIPAGLKWLAMPLAFVAWEDRLQLPAGVKRRFFEVD